MSDLGIVVLRHAILVPYKPLFCYRPDFVYQIKLKAYGFIVLAFVMIVYPVACKPNLGWDDCLISVC